MDYPEDALKFFNPEIIKNQFQQKTKYSAFNLTTL